MRYLLDTHLLLWAAEDSPRLPPIARELISDAEELTFSVASLWEIAIKAALRRDEFLVDPRELREEYLGSGYTELPITGEHALAVLWLPRDHGDPFDRLLLAQAMHEGMTLVTTDRKLAAYQGPILLV